MVLRIHDTFLFWNKSSVQFLVSEKIKDQSVSLLAKEALFGL